MIERIICNSYKHLFGSDILIRVLILVNPLQNACFTQHVANELNSSNQTNSRHHHCLGFQLPLYPKTGEVTLPLDLHPRSFLSCASFYSSGS
jgi:hypothetical protein